ncbi:accessory Sec system protein Asp2 [Pseudobutyrivibrio ruminis]|uniref:accessory Sec system protein Asp2 n=1 Tax=Pseudobutyrivibrio ruminis TaxID=46206 RepID=UPI00040123E3|nr:accessory Sec system protein Asp2 [Pseudobutyrivibrio ruminis]
MDKIKVLVVSDRDWNSCYTVPDYLRIISYKDEVIKKKDIYEIVILEKNIEEDDFDILKEHSYSYCLFAVKDLQLNDTTKMLFAQRMGKILYHNEIQSFLDNDAKKYFSKPYGEKLKPSDIGISRDFKGKISWDGNYCVNLEGDYGSKLNQIAFWRNNIPITKGQAIEFWLEYKKDESVDISLSIKEYAVGSLADEIEVKEFSEDDLKNPVIIEGKEDGEIFCSVNASGTGKLGIIALHDRVSHYDVGSFMVGGKRFVTSEGEEIFAYFDPGDLKPPLAVYFSGYKTLEGFEGYQMMRKMGCPFLLIADQRFEGGGFYMGSPEYEKLMVDIVDSYLAKLDFYPNELILSGISMGTTGAMFYGCDLKPHALIIGKPLVSLGDIAFNERLKRPKGFATSLDLLNHYGGGMDEGAIDRLNEKFWEKLRHTDFSRTKFIVSYMIEDDYDSTAYEKLLSELNSSGVQVYGKGLHGRHNDNTLGITTWFKGQYDKVLKNDFNRK